MKTSELIGPALDWAVAKCEIANDVRDNRQRFWVHPNNKKLICRQTYNHETNPKGFELCSYSTDWSQGGPIIERKRISVFNAGFLWFADMKDERDCDESGPAPLIAAMRCYVSSELGDTVDIPEELK